VFCEGVQHRLQFCLDHLKMSNWWPFTFSFNRGKREKWGTTLMLFLVNNSWWIRKCTGHAFFPKRLSNHCQGLHRTFSEICTKFDAYSRSIASRTSTQLREILHTASQDMLILASTVASRYYNCCTNAAPVPAIMEVVVVCWGPPPPPPPN
jgi:hypothetical protein